MAVYGKCPCSLISLLPSFPKDPTSDCVTNARSSLFPKVFRARTPPEAIALVSRLLEYTPSARISPLQACAHPFFNELREAYLQLPSGRGVPPLFNFTEHGECDYCLSHYLTLTNLLFPCRITHPAQLKRISHTAYSAKPTGSSSWK